MKRLDIDKYDVCEQQEEERELCVIQEETKMVDTLISDDQPLE